MSGKTYNRGFVKEAYTGEARDKKVADPGVRVPEPTESQMLLLRKVVRDIRDSRQVYEEGSFRDVCGRTNPVKVAAPKRLQLDKLSEHHHWWEHVVENDHMSPSFPGPMVYTSATEKAHDTDDWPMIDVTVKEMMADCRRRGRIS